MILFKNLEKFKDNIFFIENNTKKYYKDFFKFEKKFIDLKSRKLALLASNNSSEFLQIYLTFLRKDIVIMLIDYNTNQNTINKIIDAYKPFYIFFKKEKFKSLKNYKITHNLEENVIYERKTRISYQIFDNLSLLLSTSGSTGSQKFVRVSKKNLISNTQNIC